MNRYMIFCLTAAAIFLAAPSFSQSEKKTQRKGKYAQKPNRKSDFLKTQWWLGFYGGVNVAEAEPDQQYTGIVALNYEESVNEKSYSSFSQPAGQAGIDVTFFHKGFSFSFKPNYRVEKFSYTNSYIWYSDDNALNSLQLSLEQEHILNFVELPIFIKYDILSGKLRPFVQAGAFYRILMNADKSISTTGVDYASGGNGPFQNQTVTIGAEDLFVKSSAGVIGGVGCTYDVWNVRLILDVSYRMGLNNISNAENRYSENPLTGIGDAMDDLTLNSISVNIGCVFPLRFISKDLKAID
jgi:outer membrane protein W